MVIEFVKKFQTEFRQFPLAFQLLFGFTCLSLVLAIVSIPQSCKEAKRNEERVSVCRELCLPNGFKEVRANQCFCEASIVVKPLSEVK